MDIPFLIDLHQAFDKLISQGGYKPVLLTSGSDQAFSVGLDFDYCFELFGRQDNNEIADWFDFFRSALIKVYAYPGKTVAAVSGHAFAGGLILAISCDYRIGVDRKTRYALNEVPIGIPMPAVYNEMIRQRVGDAIANDTVLTGRVFDERAALQMGFLHKLVKPDTLFAECRREIRSLPVEAWEVYAHTKKLLLRSSMEFIDGLAKKLDEQSVRVISSSAANAAQQLAMARLKRAQKLKQKLAR